MPDRRKDERAHPPMDDADTHIAPAAGAGLEERLAALEKRVRQLQSVLDALLQLRARDQRLEEDLVRRRAEAQQDVMARVTQRLHRRQPDAEA